MKLKTKQFLIFAIIAVLSAFSFADSLAFAFEQNLEFDEIVRSADIIFAGTVSEMACRVGPKRNTIVTDVTFKDIALVHKKKTVKKDISQEITLTFLGGRLGKIALTVSDMPSFKEGERYMVFSTFDGEHYVNPIVGGTQGLFQITEDKGTGEKYVLTASGRGFHLKEGKLKSGRKIKQILNGIAEVAPPEITMVPLPEDAPDGSIKTLARESEEIVSVLTFKNFKRKINKVLASPAQKKPDKKSSKKAGITSDKEGKISPKLPESASWQITDDGEILDAEGNPLDIELLRDNNSDTSGIARKRNLSETDTITALNDTLGFYAYWDLPIVMEMLPESWWNYSWDQWGMNQYNEFMDVYRMRDDDGSYGYPNFYSEFFGFVSDAALYDLFGHHWGNARGYTFYWNISTTIFETDIVFNGDIVWTDDLEEALSNQNLNLYQTTLMHELGHSWGLMPNDGNENYDYDIPTVMHSRSSTLVEDGSGIHFKDAALLRGLYWMQTPIMNVNDLGVESYYAQGGLHNATTDRQALKPDGNVDEDSVDGGTYEPGFWIILNNITVENMSNTSTSNVRLRVFLSKQPYIGIYCSPDEDWTHGDYYQLGTYVQWPSFTYESYWTGNITSVIPDDIPPGDYYINLVVTGNSDDCPSALPGVESWETITGNNLTRMYPKIHIVCPDGPPPPANITASTNKVGYVWVSWDSVSGASGYEVSRLASGGTWEILTNKNLTSAFMDETVAPGKSYDYRVRSYNFCGSYGEYPVQSEWATGITPFSAPQNVSACEGCSAEYISVTWDQVPGTNYYGLYRSDSIDRSKAINCANGTTLADEAYEDSGTGCSKPIPGKDFYYWIAAGESSYIDWSSMDSDNKSYSVAEKGYIGIAAPSFVDASKGTYTDHVFITWDAVSYSDAYQLYRNSTDDPSTATALTSWVTSRKFTDLSAVQNRSYYYWVKTRGYHSDRGGYFYSDFSFPDKGYKTYTPLPAPTGVTATDGKSASYVTVTWTAPIISKTPLYYRVFRKKAGAIDRILGSTLMIRDWATEDSFNDTSSEPGVDYEYMVVAAIDDAGTRESDFSAPDIGWKALSAPNGVKATTTLGGHISVSWNSYSGATYYRVYRNTTTNNTSAVAIGTWQTATTYDDWELSDCNINYYYWVKTATNQSGNHASASSSLYGTGSYHLQEPTGVTASDGASDAMVTVSWDSVQGASYYRIWRNTTNSLTGAQSLGSWQTETQYDDITAEKIRIYYYWVEAGANSSGLCGSNKSISDSGWRGYSAPTGVSATDGAYVDKVRITWATSPDATFYQVYRSMTSVIDDAAPISSWQTETSYDDTTADSGQPYYYWVRVARSDSPERASAFSTPDVGWRELAVPQGIYASNGTYREIVNIQWNKVKGATLYCVYRSLNNDPGTAVQVGVCQAGTSFDDKTAELCLQYYYWVKASNLSEKEIYSTFSLSDSGWLKESDEDADGVCDSVDNCPAVANADQLDADNNGIGDACEQTPTAVTLSFFEARQSGKKVVLKWKTASESNNEGFNILRSESAGNESTDREYVKINKNLIKTKNAGISGAKYKFKDNNIKSGKKYLYRIEDINMYGVSTFHDPIEIKITAKKSKTKKELASAD
ncbi:MAG: thrombospondin type 3 repeat-containing protein [Candidatus Schekmanbacteria bacterium]|nr:thrombospondin type 3 repeat-containing protein [Candidatus Schekmanbacteria bacterium]